MKQYTIQYGDTIYSVCIKVYQSLNNLSNLLDP